MPKTKKSIQWRRWVDPYKTILDKDGQTDTAQIPCSLTPFGIVPIHEGNSPSDVFNIWVGHTNFTLTQQIAKTIAGEPGVEGVDILSRYRLRVVVGDSFSESAVLKGLEVTICQDDGTAGLSPVLSFMQTVPESHHWALVKLANKRVFSYANVDINKVRTWVSLFGELPLTSIVSWGASYHD